MLINITTLPGDGIGPEVTDQAVHVLQAVAEAFDHRLKITQKNIGGAALVANNDPLPSDTVQSCLASGAVLLGAVGGPAFDSYPAKLRPEAGLLRPLAGSDGSSWRCHFRGVCPQLRSS